MSAFTTTSTESSSLLRCRTLQSGLRGFLDDPDNSGRVRRERHVTRVHLARGGAHPARELALQDGIDGLVLARDQIPARELLPCRRLEHLAEDLRVDRLLARRHHAALSVR